MAESEPLWEITGRTFVISSSVKISVSMVASLASILSAFPRMVLISPLCTMRRFGWARFQLGAVFVENRECTIAMADS